MREEAGAAGEVGAEGPTGEARGEVRRGAAIALAALAVALTVPAAAPAAPPSVEPVAATDIQGVSALLKGTIDPGGAPTTYSFEYVEEANFETSGFATAISTPAAPAGSGSGPHPARAAIAGLTPNTSYRYRLLAQNADGDDVGAPATFATTPGFGFLPGEEGFAVTATADGGGAATKAGSHPYKLEIGIGLRLGGEFEGQPGVPFPDGDLRNLQIGMPPGLLLNPEANQAVAGTCNAALFHTPRISPYEASASGESCPADSQVGTVDVSTSAGGGAVRRFGVFKLQPAPGVAAQLGFAPYGSHIVLDVRLREAGDGSYPILLKAANVSQTLDVRRLDLSLWGVPRGASHNGERGNCLNQLEPNFPWAKCSVGSPFGFPPRAFVTLPSSCGGPLSFTATATAWQQPKPVSAAATSGDAGSEPVDLDCANLGFASHPTGLLTTDNAATASGFGFDLTNEAAGLIAPGGRAPSQVRSAVVTLPEGVTVNPSLGVGLGYCTPAQYAAETAFSAIGANCPGTADIGEFTVTSPLFDGLFEGRIYLAQPDDPATTVPGAENPFDTMIAVYLVAQLPERGIAIKVAGKIVPDPGTGRPVATFEDLPQLPYDNLSIDFRATQRAALISPPTCGSYATQTELTPWGGVVPPVKVGTATEIDVGFGGGPCPDGTAPPFSPAVIAGGLNSSVGTYTPYFVRISRKDTEQEITSYSLTLPRGITGKLAGIPFCPDAAIAAARTRQGAAETADPSCPAASQIGRTDTAYGIGSALARAPGRIYLAGPYRGQPISVATINAATVGPFDLGTVVIRSAFAVDPETAQLRIDSRASDPIPHMLDGIPLHLRVARVYMDRDRFTRNPTSCEASELVSTLTGAGTRFDDPSDDPVATASSFFQLLSCRDLGFRPKLGLRLRGGSGRGDYPSLRATFAPRGEREANLKRIAVSMPHSLFLAQNHIRAICTREQFAADRCPAGSIYGTAVAATPLFDEPMRGPIYLRSSSNRLPDLVASLHSGAIRIVLTGRIGPTKRGIRTLFENVPDVPIERFTMTLRGGNRGLLVNAANICVAEPLASVKALGQNNRGAIFTARLRGQCKAKSPGKGGDRK
jgi:hypothetical protein